MTSPAKRQPGPRRRAFGRPLPPKACKDASPPMFERRPTSAERAPAANRASRRGAAALPARAALVAMFLLASMPLLAARASTPPPAAARSPLAGSPIKHVVVIFQENHSFNDLLGKLCVDEGHRCEGTTNGVISDGTKVPLQAEPDVVPSVGHLFVDQAAAMNHGAMDGRDKVGNCTGGKRYGCLVQAQAGTVPTLWSLADTYTISDHTFETGTSASWGSHIELVAATIDGFVGDPYFNVSGIIKGNACEGKT